MVDADAELAGDVEAAYDGQSADERDEDRAFVPRRHAADWASTESAEEYVSRAS